MLLEHLLYSAALAILVGVIFLKYTGKDPTWLIVVMSAAPDIDYPIHMIMKAFNFSYPVMINHGDFHNILSLLFISLCVALVLSKVGMNFVHVLICSMIGYGAHFVEDFIVYPPAYAYFFPFGTNTYGINLIPETGDLIVAGSEVLVIGLVLFCLAVGVRMYFDGAGWTIKQYVNDWLNVGNEMRSYTEILLFGNTE
jgi:hypothetical protein